MTEEDKQLWLDPEWKKEHDRIVRHEIGKKISEGNIYEVPGISVDKSARELMKDWPVEVSARRIRILRPYALVAELEPKDIFDFEHSSVKNIVITKHDETTVKIEFEINGEKKLSWFIYHPENNKVEHQFYKLQEEKNEKF
jgi:hypothetical protein